MQDIELINKDWRMAVRPAVGGAVSGLWWRDAQGGSAPVEVPILRPMPAHSTDVRLAASYPLVPYSNRIAHAQFRWNDRDFSVARNFGDHPHAIHGLGWQRPWTVVKQDDVQLVLQLDHEPDADWPWAFRAEQLLALREDCVEWRISITSRDRRVQPAGVGWHPYFLTRAGAQLDAPVMARWDNDAIMLPQARVALEQLKTRVDESALDNCFEGWTGVVRIEDEQVQMQLTSNLRYLVVYTPSGAGHFCVEPVSHRNDAINAKDPQAHGLVRLQIDERLQAWMRLRALSTAPTA